MYGVSKDEQAALVAIVCADREVPRHDPHDAQIPYAYREYLVLESAATQILCYEPFRIPELVQTPAYAKAAGRVQASSSRHRQLTMRPLHLTILITEQALRNTAEDGTVIRDQVRALAEMGTAYSRIAIHILPAHGAVDGGPATILRFAGASSLAATYLPGLPGQGGACLVSPDEVADSIRAFEALRMDALDADESARLLRRLASGRSG